MLVIIDRPRTVALNSDTATPECLELVFFQLELLQCPVALCSPGLHQKGLESWTAYRSRSPSK